MGADFPRVLLLGDETKGQVRRVLDSFLPWVEKRARVVGVELDRDRALEDFEADFCLVFGGDGSILSAARRMGRNQIPTLGINLGKLGFLAEVSVDGLREAVAKAFAGELCEETRLLVECRPPRSEGREILILNDAVIQRTGEINLIEISVEVGGDFVSRFLGDGLIMATAVGSTAYSLAAGGPILAPDVEALVLTPLAPHALPVRPLVVPSRRGVEMVLEGKGARNGALLALDGQVHHPLKAGDRLSFRVSDLRFRLLTLQDEDFYSILRRKFGWAGTPRYEGGGE